MDVESSEARTFKRQFAFLTRTIKPELRAIATELYANDMISDSTRDKAYAPVESVHVEGFLVDIECKIRTDPAYFHAFLTVLSKIESLKDMASHLAADHRRLSTPTTTAERMAAVYRSGLDQCDSSDRAPTCVQSIFASYSSSSSLVDSGSETERSGSFNRNHGCPWTSPQSESVPVAETSGDGHSSSSTQVISGLHDRLKGVEHYVAIHFVGRPEAESSAKQVEELNSKLEEMRIELDEKNKAISNLQTEMKEFKDDNAYLVRRCRTLESERHALSCKVGDIEKQCNIAKEQASVLAREKAAFLIIQQSCMNSKAKPNGRCKSWPVTRQP